MNIIAIITLVLAFITMTLSIKVWFESKKNK